MSRLSAWIFLFHFSLRRQFRLRQMVGIALGLLAIIAVIITIFTFRFGWDRMDPHLNHYDPYQLEWMAGSVVGPLIDRTDYIQGRPRLGSNNYNPYLWEWVVGGAVHPFIDQSDFMKNTRKETSPIAVFSRRIVFALYLNFLMPLWCLSFATAAIGTDRENKSLIWLLTRPMPRWSIYLAKFLGVLPWCIVLNLAGFAILCLAGGSTGREAFGLFWPGVLAGSLAFTALYAVIGAVFTRPAVVGMLYAFFFETILSELPVPGTIKRLSINYYVRCLMYESAEVKNIPTESGVLFVPLSPTTAWVVLIGATILLTAVGMWMFSRLEYRDDG